MRLNGTQKIFAAVVAGGVSFLFDSGLLALSIILFLHGPKLVVGMRKALYFPTRKLKIGGTWCFLGGALLVYFAWPLFMTIVQALTFLDLFGGAIPLASVFLRGLPFIGKFLTLPYARAVAVALAAYFSI